MSVDGRQPCTKCRGAQHVFDATSRLWAPCLCVRRLTDADLARRSGVTGEARPLSDFGDGFSTFYRTAVSFPGASSLIGPFPILADAAQSFLAQAARRLGGGRLIRLGDAVDAWFDRDRKRAFVIAALSAGSLALLCGDEPPHSWNGPILATLADRRRLAGNPTLIAATGDIVALYGERVDGLFGPRSPSFMLRPT